MGKKDEKLSEQAASGTTTNRMNTVDSNSLMECPI